MSSGGVDLEVRCLGVVEAVHRLDAVGHVDGEDEHRHDDRHGQNAGPDGDREEPDVAADRDRAAEHVPPSERLHLAAVVFAPVTRTVSSLVTYWSLTSPIMSTSPIILLETKCRKILR